MTRLFLAAGVAMLAIAVPATAGPGGHGGNKDDERRAQVLQQRGGGGGQRAQVVQQRGGGGQRAQVIQQRGGGGFAAMRAERAPRFAAPARSQRFTAIENRPQRMARPEMVNRQQVRTERVQRVQARVADRQQLRAQRVQQVQNRVAGHQPMRAQRTQPAQTQLANRQQLRANRLPQVQGQLANRQQVQANRVAVNTGLAARPANATGVGFGIGGCPPGLAKKAVACMPPGQAAKLGFSPVVTAANVAQLRAARVDLLNRDLGTRILAPSIAASLLGTPIGRASTLSVLNPLPLSASYLYPDTPDYYYRYGDGYLYQVDRSTSLIDALLPLLGAGYFPGQYLPTSYMNSFVPDYYGFNAFYPDNPYVCNRYINGVVYQVDCLTGMIEGVVPMYAGGYGVGQLLPSSYSYYNVPYGYRNMYYDTPDAGYWYAPGAIYQYDRSSSMITSVAALLSPGFSVGQPLPLGYDAYNVPYGYRSTYYDTPTSWYRYNNGYIYQVDPTTQLVTAIVASLLT
jgi:hypothetical protein